MMRHGQSQWNKLNLFTGWVDIPLSHEGIEESLSGGKLISKIPIDIIFVSSLTRALMTAMLAMSLHTSGKVPVLLHFNDGKMEAWAKIHRAETEKECMESCKALIRLKR
jgi:2,3-bisphosphoglycerate-dependent phosphoglycerate mutase